MAFDDNKVRIKFEVKTKDAIRELENFGVQIDKTKNKVKVDIDKIGEGFRSAGKKLSLFVTAPLVALGGVAAKTAGEFEKQQVAFETLLGSADRAKKLLNEIVQFSAKTPFQLPQLEEAATQLLAVGTALEDVVPQLEMLGNVAMGDSEKMGRLVHAFAKLRSRGRATMEELNMFIEAGVPIMQALADQFNITTQEVFKYVQTGKVGFKDVQKALMDMTAAGGKYHGMIEKQSQTFLGLISTLKDNLGLLLKDFGDIMLPVLKEVVNKVMAFVQWFRELNPTIKKTIIIISALAAAIPPLLLGLGQAIKIFGIMKTAIKALGLAMNFLTANPIGAIITAIGLLITAGYFLVKNWDKVKEALIKIWGWLSDVAMKVFLKIEEVILKSLIWVLEKFQKVMQKFGLSGDKIGRAIDSLKGKLEITKVKMDNLNTSVNIHLEGVKRLKEAFAGLKQSLTGYNKKTNEVIDSMKNTNDIVLQDTHTFEEMKSMLMLTKDEMKSLKVETDTVKDSFLALNEMALLVTDTFKTSFADAWESIWLETGSTSKKIKEAIKDMFITILKAVGKQYAIMSAAMLLAGQFGKSAKYAALSATAFLAAQAINKLQQGGLVKAQQGIEYGGGDIVPAALEPGEMVIRKEVVREHYAELQAINSGEGTPMNISIYLGSRLIYNEISKATRDGKIIIDKRAVR